MRTFTLAFQRSGPDFFQLLKKEAGALLGILLGCEFVDQTLLWIERSTVTLESQNLTFAMLRLLMGMILAFLVAILVFRSLGATHSGGQRLSLWQNLRTYLAPLALEGLRALGWILLWSLLFLLPGIYKYVRYSFVNAVVLLDPDYMSGKVDALEESHRLTEAIWIQLLLLILVGGVGVVFLEFQKEKYPAFAAPSLWFIWFTLLSALTVYLNVLLYEIYSVKKTGQGSPNGTDI